MSYNLIHKYWDTHNTNPIANGYDESINVVLHHQIIPKYNMTYTLFYYLVDHMICTDQHITMPQIPNTDVIQMGMDLPP